MPGFPLAVLAQLAPCCITPCIAGSQRVRGESSWGKTLLPSVIRMHGFGQSEWGTWFRIFGPSGAVHVTGSGAREVSNLVVSGQGSVELVKVLDCVLKE